MSTSCSPLVSAGMCLRVLRRLLDDESAVLAQLSYVVENIHNPILENCDPVYIKLLPEVPPSVPPSSLAVLTQRASGAPSPVSTSNSSSGPTTASAALKLLPPQPAIVQATSHPSPQTTSNSSNKPAQPRRTPAGRGRGGSGGTKAADTVRVLTFSEYWELFANLPTLYAAQRGLVKRLEGTVRDVTALLDRLQGEQERAEQDADDVCGADKGSHPNASQSIEDVHDKIATPTHTDALTEGDSFAQVSSAAVAATPIPTDRSPKKLLISPRTPAADASVATEEIALRTLGEIICAFFSSEEMMRVVAEHTMYTVNYTSKSAPRILELGRLWRRGGGGAPLAGGGGGGPPASTAPLTPADRAVLLRYSRFLDFLLRSFGNSGVPGDCRVAVSALPELPLPFALAVGGNAVSKTGSSGPPGSGNGGTNVAGGAGTVRGQMTLDANVNGVPKGGGSGGTGGSGSGGVAAAAGGAGVYYAPITNVGGGGAGANGRKSQSAQVQYTQLPPIPANWKGFHTLVMLLSTPLSCLRRYLHVARCIVESHTILREARQKLQTSFINTADAQVIEEGVLAVEELAQHDVRAIMSLIDDSSSATIVGADGTTGGSESGASLLAQFRNPSTPRILVHYGRLYKRSGRGKHERLMFLFTDWICYVEELSNGRMRLRGAMPLDTLRVIDVADSPTLDIINCFELINAQTKRFIFFVSTPEQKRQWVDAIRFAVGHLGRARLRAKLAATNATSNSSMTAVAAATAIHTSMFQHLKPTNTSAPLPHGSRLCRQRRYDQAWQNYLDSQNAAANSRLASPPLSLMTSGAHGGGLPGSVIDTPPLFHGASDVTQPPALQGGGSTAGAHHSRSSSFGQSRNVSAHRQLEYDVTPWSRQSATHRRLRGSQDLIMSTPTAAVATLGSHSRQSSLTSVEEGNDAANDKADRGDGDIDEPGRASFGSRLEGEEDDTTAVDCADKDGGDGGAAVATDDPLRMFKLHPGVTSPFLSNLPHPPSKTDSMGGASTSSRPPIPGTPLRRPVSERFEVVQSSPNSSPGGARRSNSVSAVGVSQRSLSNQNNSSPQWSLGGAAVPPRAPASSTGSFPRASRDSPSDKLQLSAPDLGKHVGDSTTKACAEGLGTTAADAGSGSSPRAGSTKEEIDSQLSSLVREQEQQGPKDGSAGEAELGNTSFRSGTSSSSHHDHGEHNDHYHRSTHHRGDNDSNEGSDDVGTGSDSIIEAYAGGARSGITGDTAPSEDAADLPFDAQMRVYEASPTAFDDEERVSVALTAFRAQEASPCSVGSSPIGGQPPRRPLGNVVDGSDEPSMRLLASATGSNLGSAPTAQTAPSPHRYVDPSHDLEALLQQVEAREEKGRRETGNRSGAEAEPDGTDDGGVEFDAAEKGDMAELMVTPDTSLELSEKDVKQQKSPP